MDNSRQAQAAGSPVPLGSGVGLADSAGSPTSSSDGVAGRDQGSASGPRWVFEPDPGLPATVEWLTALERAELAQVLDDLPEQARQLGANYWALAGRGDRDPLDRSVRYPLAFDPVDLADQRTKPDVFDGDVPDNAELAGMAGARRQGILPTLLGWVGVAADAMARAGIPFDPPEDPTEILLTLADGGTIRRTRRQVSVHSQASWLRHHLDFVYGQPWAVALHTELAGLGRDLTAVIGPAQAYPDQHTTLTAPQLADRLDVPYGTVRWWIHEGHLKPATDATGQPVTGPKGRAVYYLTEGRGLALTRKPRKDKTR